MPGMRPARVVIVIASLALTATTARSQESAGPAAADQAVEPIHADVETIDGIVTAFYDVISGDTGVPRQWARDATLYLDGIQFTPVRMRNGRPSARLTPKQAFIDAVDAFVVDNGFVEEEIHRVTRAFGYVADVASTYAWRTADGQTGRGINFIHLFHDGDRWWISHATWDSERDDNPIPPEFLPDA